MPRQTRPVDRDRRAVVEELTAVAARLDELAEVADLMGDAAGARRYRDLAARRCAEAMALMDDDR
jgi:hypothetical protein